MARAAKVMCRICRQSFDRANTVKDEYWVNPSNKMYYHKTCYDEFQKKKLDLRETMTDEMWFNAMWDFLRKELKGDFNFLKVRNQWENFLKKKMTAKGIFFATKYFYDIKKGDISKSENGIGIVPHIYEDSCTYWQERNRREVGICDSIERQLLEAANKKTTKVNLAQRKKKTVSAADRLAAIMNMEDDE